MTLALTRAQVRRVDELAVSKYGMVGVQLMENAGRNAAEVIDQRYGPKGTALVACGGGNNGGDGFVIARHLTNRGWKVACLLAADESKLSPDCAVNHRIVRAMGIPVVLVAEAANIPVALTSLNQQAVIIDALLGTGFFGEVRSPAAELIDALNAGPHRAMVAVDLPSGLDCDYGRPAKSTIKADVTVTFVARKVGFDTLSAQPFVGDVVVADIGAPIELVRGMAAP